MKKLFKINQHEYLKTDRQGNICLRTTDANKLNKNKFISTFQNKLYRFFKNLCTRSTLKVHLFFKASSCETNFVSGNKLFKNSLAKILLGKNQKNKLIFWYWYETLPCLKSLIYLRVNVAKNRAVTDSHHRQKTWNLFFLKAHPKISIFNNFWLNLMDGLIFGELQISIFSKVPKKYLFLKT